MLCLRTLANAKKSHKNTIVYAGKWFVLVFVLGFLSPFIACSDYLGGGPGTKKEKTQEPPPAQPDTGNRDEPTPDPSGPEKEAVQNPDESNSTGENPQNPESDAGTTEALPEQSNPPETTTEKPPIPDNITSQVRSCEMPFSIDLRRLKRGHCDRDVPTSVTSVAVAGEFNQWKPVFQLKDDDGDRVWKGQFQIKPENYAFKYVLNGNTWCLAPHIAEEKYVGGRVNTLVRVPNCQLPLLRLETVNAPVKTGKIEVDITYLDGAGKHGMDASSLDITVNGTPYKGAKISSDGKISIRMQGLSQDRYTFRVNIKDKQGQKAKQLYFFAWVEDTRFQWKDAFLYFAFVDRFVNGDKSNDKTIPNLPTTSNYQGGDLKGVLDKINDGYFKKMGINAIWLSPLYDGPDHAEKGIDGKNYSGYHGYWPVASRKLEPRFGDWKIMQKLVRAAHKQGIRVLVDLASNHVHKDHPYWKQHQQSGWFHNYISCPGSNWSKPIECWFDAFLPDLNYQNFKAAEAMVGDAVYWAQEGELDGFRVDAVKHMIHLFSRNVRAALDREVTHQYTHFYLVGETFTGSWKDGGGSTIKAYVLPEELSGQFDFPVYWEILGALGRRENGFGLRRLDGVLKNSMDNKYYGNLAIMSNFIGNHDVPRFISHAAGQVGNMWGGDRNKAWNNPPGQPTAKEPYDRIKVAFSLMMALPGIPLVYYGDEIGLAGDTDPDNRRLMPFTGWNKHQKEVLAHVQKLGQLRNKYPALRSDQRRTLWVDDEWFAMLRTEGKQRMIFVLRRGGRNSSLSLPVNGLLKDGDSVQDVFKSGSLSVSGGKLNIPLNANEGTFLLLP